MVKLLITKGMLETLPEIKERCRNKQYIEWKELKQICLNASKASQTQDYFLHQDILANSHLNFSSEFDESITLRRDTKFKQYSENDPLRELRIKVISRANIKDQEQIETKSFFQNRIIKIQAAKILISLVTSALIGYCLAKIIRIDSLQKALLIIIIIVGLLYVQLICFILRDQREKRNSTAKTNQRNNEAQNQSQPYDYEIREKDLLISNNQI